MARALPYIKDYAPRPNALSPPSPPLPFQRPLTGLTSAGLMAFYKNTYCTEANAINFLAPFFSIGKSAIFSRGPVHLTDGFHKHAFA